MRKTLLLLLLNLSLCGFGQTPVYHPFPTNNGSWVYRYYDDMHNPTFIFSDYSLNGDTIISSVNYKKIGSGSVYFCAIRENAKIIYFIPDTSATEYLLYDFNLDVGDTIINPFGGALCSNGTVTINFVDSILLSDGYHRQLYLSSMAMWIEGVGSLNHLLEPCQVYCLSGDHLLECLQSDAPFLYPEWSTSCAIGLRENNTNIAEIRILPNPSSGSFIIDAGSINTKEIFISDILGNIIVRQNIDLSDKIYIEKLSAGTYFLTLIDINGQSYKSKIISNL